MFEQFKLLMHTTNVDQYYDEFEKLKGRMLEKIPQLSEEFFVGNFVGGLEDNTKKMVKMLGPDLLSQAFKQAKVQEAPIPKPTSSFPKPQTTLPYSAITQKRDITTPNISNTKLPMPRKDPSKPKPITAAQRDERKAKGLFLLR